jgi:AcrR family transcriptional regulator
VAEARSARVQEVVAAARRVLEAEGPEALTMRRVAGEVGVRAPSLYKHLPHKSALEAAVIADGFAEAAAAFEAPSGLEARTAAPLLAAVGGPERARAAWAFLHGMTLLELNDRFPADGRTEQAWAEGVAAFRRPPPP